jgi:hypothetical protein
MGFKAFPPPEKETMPVRRGTFYTAVISGSISFWQRTRKLFGEFSGVSFAFQMSWWSLRNNNSYWMRKFIILYWSQK